MVGRSGGFVSTARVTHATPAATYAHTSYRKWESDENIPDDSKACKDIAYQFVYDNPNIQVMDTFMLVASLKSLSFLNRKYKYLL